MKNIKKTLIGILASLFVLQSCDVLDVDPTNNYSESTAYASIKNLDLYVKGFYTIFYANADINISEDCVMDDGVSDLIKYSWYNVAQGKVNMLFYQNNYFTADGNFRSNWDRMYTHIRQQNEYFYDLSRGYAKGLDEEALALRTAEVRFMRAFAYQELVLRHGGVILRIDEDKVDGQHERAKARSSEAECWDFIINEYDKAAKVLPEKWEDMSEGNNVGRLTKGAAYGMKARAALYAKRWQVAIDATNEVTKLAEVGHYQLLSGDSFEEYNKIFTVKNNKELIIPVNFEREKLQHKYDFYFCPPFDHKLAGIPEGSVGAAATPTDEYASSFDIQVNGSWQAFKWSDLLSYTDGPWANRDPRFYASILYNGATWKDRPIELYVDGRDGYMDFSTSASQDFVHKSTTGYLFRKFMNQRKDINFSNIQSDQFWIEMRYAEIFFIRSEAHARLNNFVKAYENLNVIRKRVNMPDLVHKNVWEDYLVDLSKERICELGLEGHRYFDIIRWGIAQDILHNKRVHGIKIKQAGVGFTYTPVECDTQGRYFPEKYTIFPIPSAEIRNNTLCVQNDLWK